ncbi:MAG: CDP-alcohol phosphatidyltransferase family protein [Acidobacteria bacterium]|nr:CDP-alcohol phosphatidyltransferase family protein [Acidobacteriota bacterium]MCI0662312.1 CDP-alcohol phosphatidyltransferase family protein [Acidobacteriota bacterium]
MSPNLITLIRVFMAFASIALFGAGTYASLIALSMLLVALTLDAVDGYVARRNGSTSDVGAAFDIAADRIVESVFWIYFASVGLISFWIPVIVVARGGFTDFLRAIAFTQGQTAFGEKSMMKTWWGKLLVGSRASRAAYGVIKCAAFFALGLWLTLANAPQWQAMLAAGLMNMVKIGALALAIATVVFCVARGVPVIIEGIRFFREDLALLKVW